MDNNKKGGENRSGNRSGGSKRPPIERHIDPYGEKTPREESERGTIEGKNAVIEALRAGTPLDKVFIMKGDGSATLAHIASAAREAGAVVVDADKRKLDGMSKTGAHQGVVALIPAAEYASVEDILNRARERNEQPLIIVCDEISDTHNLGAIIRTAEASGAHGVIIPKRRSAGLTAIVAKTSAGAAFHLPVARVSNISTALRELKTEGVWIYGADMSGENTLWNTDFKGAVAFVIGSEGSGLERLVKEDCDFLVKIPMSGKISSLNASVSAALLMYETARQRANI